MPGVKRPEEGAAVQSGGQDGQKGLGRSQDQHFGAENTVTARRLLMELQRSKEGPFCQRTGERELTAKAISLLATPNHGFKQVSGEAMGISSIISTS